MKHAEAISGYLDQLRITQVIATTEEIPGTKIGTLVLDHERRQLRGTIAYVKLPCQEYTIIARLSRRAGMIVTFSDLISALYENDPNSEPDSSAEVLRICVMNLRRKLLMLGNTVQIVTERGVGYSVEVKR